jgi:negative regulator of flagellin synthesis FlgM
MIISGNNGINNASKIYGLEQIKAARNVRDAGKPGAQRSDAVVLSTEAQDLQQKIAAIKALPDVRTDKVNELTLKVESGQYKPDAAKIADQMIGRILADKLK